MAGPGTEHAVVAVGGDHAADLVCHLPGSRRAWLAAARTAMTSLWAVGSGVDSTRLRSTTVPALVTITEP
jgi:hypothetical protein